MKIKKHIKDHKEYSIYETEDGKKGIAKKSDNLSPGDKINITKLSKETEAEDLKNIAATFVEEIAWIFSKI